MPLALPFPFLFVMFLFAFKMLGNAWFVLTDSHKTAYKLEQNGRRQNYIVAATLHHHNDTIVHQQRVHKLCSARSSER